MKPKDLSSLEDTELCARIKDAFIEKEAIKKQLLETIQLSIPSDIDGEAFISRISNELSLLAEDVKKSDLAKKLIEKDKEYTELSRELQRRGEELSKAMKLGANGSELIEKFLSELTLLESAGNNINIKVFDARKMQSIILEPISELDMSYQLNQWLTTIDRKMVTLGDIFLLYIKYPNYEKLNEHSRLHDLILEKRNYNEMITILADKKLIALKKKK